MSRSVRAVLLDAFGTLVGFVEPAPALRAGLAARGVNVSQRACEVAMAAEVAHYRAHHQLAGDAMGLAALRRECASVVAESLGSVAGPLAPDDVHDALMDAISFEVFPEVPGVLAALRAEGCRLVVVSNWDISLHDVLEQTGLAEGLHGVVISAELGVAKPDARIFERALEVAGVHACNALHVGDDPVADVQGAQAAGVEALLVDRSGRAGVPDLGGLPELVRYRRRN